MTDFIYELIVMIIVTLGVFTIVAIKDRIKNINSEAEQNEIAEWDVTLNDGLEDEMVPEVEEQPTTTDEPFVDTTMPKVEFQGSHRVTLTMNGSETAPIIFTPEMLREIKQRETKAWGRYNNN